jgi:hypothetical protein
MRNRLAFSAGGDADVIPLADDKSYRAPSIGST